MIVKRQKHSKDKMRKIFLSLRISIYIYHVTVYMYKNIIYVQKHYICTKTLYMYKIKTH